MTDIMTAWGHPAPLPLSDPDCFVVRSVPRPEPGPDDLLIQVRAVGMNFLDTKLRGGAKVPEGGIGILGYEGSGEVVAAGRGVSGFEAGDRIAWLGQITRPGAMAEYCCIDARLASKIPDRVSFEEAAAVPMAFLTADGLLFRSLGVSGTGSLLIVNGAGGVGSAAIQLARLETQMTVIATASRNETREWCHRLGAHHVISHAASLAEAMQKADLGKADAIASLTATEANFTDLVKVLSPFATIGVIDQPKTLDVQLLRPMAQGLVYYGVFVPARTQDWHQGERLAGILERVASGELRPILGQAAERLTVESLKLVHQDLEAGRCIGKRVLSIG